MKLPQSFVPNKNLEKKVKQLLEGPKLIVDPEISIDDIKTNFRVYDGGIKDVDFEEFYKTTKGTTHATEIMKIVNERVKNSPEEFNVYYFDIE